MRKDPIQLLRADLTSSQIHPNRLRGQNFLICSKVRQQIIEAANINDNDTVLEIGAGTGILSWLIINKVAHTYLIEIDPSLFNILQSRFAKNPHVQLISGDGIEWMQQLNEEHLLHNASLKIISNLPYSISSPILTLMAKKFPLFCQSTFLLQQEFAEKLMASPGDPNRGPLSVLIQSRYLVKLIAYVNTDCFWPSPQVKSTIIVLEPRNNPCLLNWDSMRWIVELLFSYRRKTVLNNLKQMIPSQFLSEVSRKLGVLATSRSDLLSEQQIEEIYWVMSHYRIDMKRNA